MPEDAIAASCRYGAERAPRILGMQRRHAVVVLPITIALLCALVIPSTVRSVIRSRARAKIADAPTETNPTDLLWAADRSLRANFPIDFDSTVDEHGAFLSLHRPKKLEMIVLISSARSDIDDPRDLDRIMTKDLAGYATKTGATMSTTITVDGDCHAMPGVVSTATLSKPDNSDDIPLKVVSYSAQERAQLLLRVPRPRVPRRQGGARAPGHRQGDRSLRRRTTRRRRQGKRRRQPRHHQRTRYLHRAGHGAAGRLRPRCHPAPRRDDAPAHHHIQYATAP